jgi:repressor LexA
MRQLTERQAQALEFIARLVEERGYPPSVRELCEHMGIASTRGALRHLEALEKKGFISRGTGARSVRLSEGSRYRRAYLPLLGEVPAGPLRYASEEIEEWVPVPAGWGREQRFILRVRGDSMVGDHIRDGDLVVVDPRLEGGEGEIVVALVGDEATVKRLHREGRRAELRSSNPAYPPIPLEEDGEEVRILGRVVSLLRDRI